MIKVNEVAFASYPVADRRRARDVVFEPEAVLEIEVHCGLETPVCHMALVADPDGNCLFIHKRKPGQG